MTFSLRRKHPITVRTSRTTARRLISAGLVVGTFLGATAVAAAQGPAMPAAPRIDPAVRPAMMQMQPPADTGRTDATEAPNPQIQLTPPGPERIFGRLDTEKEFQERARQEGLERTPADRVTFPAEPILTTQGYVRRQFPPISEFVEPNYLSFSRLYFEQKNFERFGWDLGILAPAVCVGKFFWDTALLPYHMGTQPFRKFDTNAGQCLPGDNVPLVLYPPKLSVTGAVLEAATLVGLFAAFASP